MFFLQAGQAPVIVRFGNTSRPHVKFVVPKFTMQDSLEWGTELASQKMEQATEGMDDARKSEYYTLYGQMAVDFNELTRMLSTPLGIDRVFDTCMKRAKVYRCIPPPRDAEGKPKGKETNQELPALSDEQIQSIKQRNGTGRLKGITWILADMDNQAALRDPTEDGDEEDPFKLLGLDASKPSSETGRSNSPSSRPRTATKAGGE